MAARNSNIASSNQADNAANYLIITIAALNEGIFYSYGLPEKVGVRLLLGVIESMSQVYLTMRRERKCPIITRKY